MFPQCAEGDNIVRVFLLCWNNFVGTITGNAESAPRMTVNRVDSIISLVSTEDDCSSQLSKTSAIGGDVYTEKDTWWN